MRLTPHQAAAHTTAGLPDVTQRQGINNAKMVVHLHLVPVQKVKKRQKLKKRQKPLQVKQQVVVQAMVVLLNAIKLKACKHVKMEQHLQHVNVINHTLQ